MPTQPADSPPRFLMAERAPHQATDRPWEHNPDIWGSVEDISDTLIVREQSQFLLTDASGNVPAGNRRGLGLYSYDTRHLSTYDFRLDGALPLVLLSTADSGFSQEQVLGNHRSEQDGHILGRCTIELNRQRVLDGALEERLQIINHNAFAVTLRPEYAFAADFKDMFEVRGHPRELQGQHSPPDVGERSISYHYLGADGHWRRTMVVFDMQPASISAGGATFDLKLGPHESFDLCLRVLMDEHEQPGLPHAVHRLRTDYRDWQESFAGIRTDNEAFNQVLERSLNDLRMLWTRDHGHGYLAAGTPWFATLFGRDSIIASLQTLPFQPRIAREHLALLARFQGQNVDAFHCEEPGKILHEWRNDELSVAGELPYRRYYGSVDSTPLFLLLAAEYYHWTADSEVVQELLPAIKAALHWLYERGDLTGGGFTEYATDSPGLRNQGWKDSAEAIVHADGSLCDGPIALAEVQGYVYAAYRRLYPLLLAAGEKRDAEEVRRRAVELRRRFNAAFWLDDEGYVAMAVDGEGRPSSVMSSNAGQVLWSGILPRERAHRVCDALLRNDMFSGWGIRTLSADATAYYPLGYHVGTVWPHDNGIIAQGLKRYGFDDEVNEIATSLFDAARAFPGSRLPEAFGGQPRSEHQPPVPYPVACRPQAWTAGSTLHLLQAVLGLHPDAANRRLYVIHPRLPYWLRDVHLTGVPVGDASVDLHFHSIRQRTILRVRKHGDMSVLVRPAWPRTA